MIGTRWLLGLSAAWLLVPTPAAHGCCSRGKIDRLNRRLAGHVVDYTHNHGADRRIWSAALNEPRDLYVYLPPGFDPSRCYPVMLWLHGFDQGEQSFLDQVAEPLDQAIATGLLPPLIIAAPDGNLDGKASIFRPVCFYVNSNVGNFEDYIVQDVWGFLLSHYPIRPERECHVIAGFSMGGFGAYNIAFKHPELFRVVIGICPPLNMRWVDCCGRYRANFDPCCWGWRTQVDHGREVIGSFYGGLVKVRLKHMIDPLFGHGPDALEALIRENPIEMIDRLGIHEGMYDLFVSYAGRDEYNIDAQVESFLYRARERGLTVEVDYFPHYTHLFSTTGAHSLPHMIDWLGKVLAPYCPGVPEGAPAPTPTP